MVYVDKLPPDQPQVADQSVLKKLSLVASIAAGVQFGWALQLTLLTPYTQLLGIGHKWASYIWLCGPISGLIVQPLVGHHTDRCTSRFGRRRPFIVAGTIPLVVGVLMIGFADDIGRYLGDSLEPGVKRWAVTMFVSGFWFLDVANNMIQGPCRALLADIAGDSNAMVTIGNALFSFFMAVGNMMGYTAGAFEHLYMMLPFTHTQEKRLDPLILSHWKEGVREDEKPPSFFVQIYIAARSTPGTIWMLHFVTALNWIGFFPFLLYNTDCMGKEVFGGQTAGDPVKAKLYHKGVRAGSMGLMVYVFTMRFVSLFMEPLARLLGSIKRIWSSGNFILVVCMGFTVGISLLAEHARKVALVTKG